MQDRGVNQRPRKTRKRFEELQDVRFLTWSCRHRLPLFENDAIKSAFAEHIAVVQKRCGFRMLAWVIMPEHVHLLLVPQLPEWPVSKVLFHLKGQFAGTVLRRWRELDAPVLERLMDPRGKVRFWQPGGGYDRNIYSDAEYLEKLSYIHSNPVRRGLVGTEEAWRWSSSPFYLNGSSEFGITIEPITAVG